MRKNLIKLDIVPEVDENLFFFFCYKTSQLDTNRIPDQSILLDDFSSSTGLTESILTGFIRRLKREKKPHKTRKKTFEDLFFREKSPDLDVL